MRAYTAPLYGRTFLSAREIRWHTILCTQPRSRPLKRDVKALDKLIIALNDSDGSTFLKITKSRRIYKIAGPTVPCPKTCRGKKHTFRLYKVFVVSHRLQQSPKLDLHACMSWSYPVPEETALPILLLQPACASSKHWICCFGHFTCLTA